MENLKHYLNQILPYLITYLVGVFTGAGGKYIADKYTDKRRSKESAAHSRTLFQKTASKMPGLIKEMQQDLSNSDYKLVREFFILPNKRVVFNPEVKCLIYCEEEYQDLIHNVKLLEDCGFVKDVTHTNTPKYRMSEEFVGYILKAKIKTDAVKI